MWLHRSVFYDSNKTKVLFCNLCFYELYNHLVNVLMAKKSNKSFGKTLKLNYQYIRKEFKYIKINQSFIIKLVNKFNAKNIFS